jgi:predicted nucleic acid-binding protein
MNTIPDSNVVLDVLAASPDWFEWSTRALASCRTNGHLVINPIVYAEVSGRFPEISLLDRVLNEVSIGRENIPWPAAHLAGRAHYQYRRLGGSRDRILPDFLIGAHAAVNGYRLLTRDPKRYRAYFPSIAMIAPDTHP